MKQHPKKQNLLTFERQQIIDHCYAKPWVIYSEPSMGNARQIVDILPRGFVKIRYYGILASNYKEQVKHLKSRPDILQLTQTRQQRMVRIIGFDSCKCPICKTGNLIVMEILPRIRSPDNVFYPRTSHQNI